MLSVSYVIEIIENKNKNLAIGGLAELETLLLFTVPAN